jgi:hypothetical protein
MNSGFSHARIDRINAAQDRLIARKLRRNPRLVSIARRNLARWMNRDGKEVRPVFREWERILTRLDSEELARFLISDTAMCRRLRQSSPFAGVLSKAERRAISLKHEKTRA